MLFASACCAEMACVASTQLVSGAGAALGDAGTVGMRWIRSYSDGLARINALRGQQDYGLVLLSPTGSLRLTCHFRRYLTRRKLSLASLVTSNHNRPGTDQTTSIYRTMTVTFYACRR